MKALLLLALFFAGCLCQPALIQYNHENDFAESFGYSKTLSSFIIGGGNNPPFALASVAHNGSVQQIIVDNRILSLWSIGIKVIDDMVFFLSVNSTVAFGNPPAGLQSIFVVANLTTGNITRYVDLGEIGGTIVANDLDTDNNGNWFITDSSSGRIIQVTPNDRVIEIIQDNRFKPTASPFGIDGIIYLNNFLIVNNIETSKMYKVELESLDITEIKILNANISAPDGMIVKNGKIYVAQNIAPNASVAVLETSDNWATANRISQK